MPAPIDWTAAGGIVAVQTLTVALGPREAARRLRLSPAHADALRQLCARGKWLSPEPRAVSPRAVTSHQQPVSLSPVPQPTADTLLAAAKEGRATVIPGCHQLVTKAPDALAEALSEMGGDTRLAGMEYAKLVTEHARDRARAEPEKALGRANKVKSALQSASIAGSWQQQTFQVGVQVSVGSMGVD